MDYPKSVDGVGLVDGQFVDEDKTTGRPGSLIPAEWGNSVTEELLNVIKAAGLSPSEEQSNQLLAAIRRLRGGAGNFGLWGWNTATAGSPGVGRLSLGAVDPAAASQLIIAEVSGESMDYAGPLSLLRAGDTISVQTRDSAEFSHRYRVTGDPVDNGAYRTIPVTHVSGTGAAPADNVVLSVLFTQAGASDSSIPVGSVMWWPDRRSIPKGFGPGDGQALQRSLYPDLTKMATRDMLPLATDANWWATPTERGKYTLGDGSTTIRLPDYNGKSEGSLGALFQRGDGALSAAIAGVIQRDQFQGHSHDVRWGQNGGSGGTAAGNNLATYGAAASLNQGTGPVSDGTNGAPRFGTETRALNVTGCWIIKLFGTVSNEGAADAAALATVYAALVGRVEALEARPRSLGDGQTYQDVTANRVAGTMYTNTRGRPILWLLNAYANAARDIYINGSKVAQLDLTGGNQGTVSCVSLVVPAGATYGTQAGLGIRGWSELTQ
ncbi:hypothetical protein F471_03750 [Pseudomonas sp. URMO17WK12:I1]|uniref:phosphorelay protein n=1 Tax=unclassified Pseudomonas TaxID=196821 RepID=UPI0004B37B83|nr:MULTISPECIES: phosphorelay protein [unclassified Pseudomonas]PZW65272.1 hypothetical protein F471_03750 [Pseudomonas sp. URMO17WK12:I1]